VLAVTCLCGSHIENGKTLSSLKKIKLNSIHIYQFAQRQNSNKYFEVLLLPYFISNVTTFILWGENCVIAPIHVKKQLQLWGRYASNIEMDFKSVGYGLDGGTLVGFCVDCAARLSWIYMWYQRKLIVWWRKLLTCSTSTDNVKRN
jgi:hypothetical protein